MTDTRMRFFGNLHPAVSMAYFVLVLGLTLACMHPVTVVLSFLGASWFSIRLRGWRAYGHTMRFVGPMFLLIALANPLFNHRGVTMLFTINHLWYTLEAVCYGLVSGCSLCAVIMWFTCYQEVMTSDKFLYLFGKPFPGTSLLITMTLRFIPQLQQNRREIRQSQAMLQEEGTRLLQRLGSALRNLSVLLTMSMEAAVETADSMKARGYGAKRRTTFHLFRFDGRDARTLGLILAVAGVCITARAFGHGHFRLVDLRCNSGGDHGRTVPIADVVLHDQHRSDAALLTANHRTEIGIVNIASFDVAIHFGSHSDEIDLRCCLMVFPQTYFPRVTQNYNCIMQKSGERKISSASKLSRNYSFADKQERTAGRSKVVRKFLFRNFLPPEVRKP